MTLWCLANQFCMDKISVKIRLFLRENIQWLIVSEANTRRNTGELPTLKMFCLSCARTHSMTQIHFHTSLLIKDLHSSMFMVPEQLKRESLY